ncbi:hypothetical protein [uncultured Azohydromonas sp.]|jgi:hypothetical protein|nr:hypothetical protein [uncultured Azohydromonas sp.]
MNALKEYLLLIVISVFLANSVGTAYGELANSLLSEVVLKLERVQGLVR